MIVTSPLLIAQLTDIHLFANASKELLGLPTAESFDAVLEQLKKLSPQPDLLLLTGDLSQDGKPESYHRLQDLLKPLGIPTYWLPGNHDTPEFMEQILHQAPISPEKSFQVGEWHFILLNSAVEGHVSGTLSPETLTWLDFQLQQTKQPTLIGLHHPPFLVNSDWLDSSTLQNSEELFAVIDRHSHVRMVTFGHIHQEFDLMRGSVRYLGCPSTSIQFLPESEKFALHIIEPGFRLINLYPDGTFNTKVKRVAYSHQLDTVTRGY
jgi:Icc protein